MTITDISIEENGEKTTLSARVRFKKEQPQRVYIAVENKYRYVLFADASAFLAAFLAPAMKQKENITVHGTVSAHFADTSSYVSALLQSWKVGFHHVDVSIDNTKTDTILPPFVGSFFTGGVDSFYTFLQHQHEITHLLLVHGCGIPLQNKELFASVANTVKSIAYKSDIEVIIIETNIREIVEPKLEWEWELGSALGAVSLALRNGFKKIFIPGGMRYDQLCPYGTHPSLDPLFGSNTLEIVHDGCEASRLEKVFAIARSPLTLRHLRVCSHSIRGKYNCNSCMKCVQTKIDLLCANALYRAETFDRVIDLPTVRKTYYDSRLHFHVFAQEALEFLKHHAREPQLQKALAESLRQSIHLSPVRKVGEYTAYLDKTYNKRRLYKFIFGLNKKNDRTFMFKSLSAMGLIK